MRSVHLDECIYVQRIFLLLLACFIVIQIFTYIHTHTLRETLEHGLSVFVCLRYAECVTYILMVCGKIHTHALSHIQTPQNWNRICSSENWLPKWFTDGNGPTCEASLCFFSFFVSILQVIQPPPFISLTHFHIGFHQISINFQIKVGFHFQFSGPIK